MNEWKDRARKSLRDAGKPYVNRRGELKPGKSPSKEVSGRTVYTLRSEIVMLFILCNFVVVKLLKLLRFYIKINKVSLE